MGARLQDKEGFKVKTCRACKGPIVQKNVDVEIGNVVVRRVPAEVCEKCKEKYFDTNTATFIQSVANFVKQKRDELSVGLAPT
jgi:YgiT-type zinc finger domain-containing protein